MHWAPICTQLSRFGSLESSRFSRLIPAGGMPSLRQVDAWKALLPKHLKHDCPAVKRTAGGHSVGNRGFTPRCSFLQTGGNVAVSKFLRWTIGFHMDDLADIAA
jgi:hypothetical protein